MKVLNAIGFFFQTDPLPKMDCQSAVILVSLMMVVNVADQVLGWGLRSTGLSQQIGRRSLLRDLEPLSLDERDAEAELVVRSCA